ncbi:MAG: nucleoside 2-deoxyribosyltransferase [bacterium]|nr:nucleoside 2-deoxyribosyltransferase [bacterium]
MAHPQVYLAGPDVFERDPQAAAERLKRLCADQGLEGLFPLDAGVEPDPDLSLFAARISEANENLIRRCDGVLANLSPFRGPSADPGTVYEVGFARALGKPVVGYTEATALYAERSLRWIERIDGKIRRRPSGSVEDAQGYEVENFGCVENLMIDCGIAASGGMIIRPKDGAEPGAIPVELAIETLARILRRA